MSGAVFCLSLYHVCPAHSRKSVGSAGLHFGALSEEYPIWNDFLTFSTGFSTDFVKKKWGFPQCFPLFPPSFPQKIELWVIHDVFQNGKRGKIWGEKRSQSLFLKRKSRPKIYFLRRFALGAKAPLPSGIFGAGVFHKRCPAKTMCGKPWENPSFPQTLQGERKAPPGPDGPQRRWNAGKFIRPHRCRGRRLRR